jgi:DNA topoisomerase-1
VCSSDLEFRGLIDRGKDIKPPTWEERPLGKDPVSGKTVLVRMGKFGPLAQIGAKDEVDKPRFASLRANQRIDTITLEQALDLFRLPRKLGVLPSGDEVEVNIGRFGPYVRHGKSFVSLKKDDDPFTIELPRAVELIEQKAAALAAATIKEFPGSGIRIIKGRFGPYITDGSRKANIPRTRDPATLSALDCEFFLNEAALKDKPAGKTKAKGEGKAGGAAAKPAAKKAAAKKAASSKKSGKG